MLAGSWSRPAMAAPAASGGAGLAAEQAAEVAEVAEVAAVLAAGSPGHSAGIMLGAGTGGCEGDAWRRSSYSAGRWCSGVEEAEARDGGCFCHGRHGTSRRESQRIRACARNELGPTADETCI